MRSKAENGLDLMVLAFKRTPLWSIESSGSLFQGTVPLCECHQSVLSFYEILHMGNGGTPLFNVTASAREGSARKPC
jgi:hypothetical protein